MTGDAARGGVFVNRKRVQRLMRLMGSRRSGREARTSKPAHGHKIYPYLLRNLTIEAREPRLGCDITYISDRARFLYLVAIIDWASRAVLRGAVEHDGLSSGLAALEEALSEVRKPEIFNTRLAVHFGGLPIAALRPSWRRDHPWRPRPMDDHVIAASAARIGMAAEVNCEPRC